MSKKLSQDYVEPLLAATAQEVLETMFFTTTLEEDEQPEAGREPEICGHVDFHGSPSGRFQVNLSPDAARAIAANFIGAMEEAEISEAQVDEVLRELVNMICGASVTHLDKDATFTLGSPLVIRDTEPPLVGDAIKSSVMLEEGALTMYMATDPV